MKIWMLDLGRLAISFCYRPNRQRMHRGFWRRFGVYVDGVRVVPPLR